MFELRWLEKDEPVLDVPDGFYQKIKVLQYRHIDAVHLSTSDTFYIRHTGYKPNWTEWKDVPVVEGEK